MHSEHIVVTKVLIPVGGGGGELLGVWESAHAHGGGGGGGIRESAL